MPPRPPGPGRKTGTSRFAVGCELEREPERAAVARPARDPHLAAHRFDVAPCDREADPRAAHGRVGAMHAVEGVEDPFLVLLVDADAFVVDTHDRVLFLFHRR